MGTSQYHFRVLFPSFQNDTVMVEDTGPADASPEVEDEDIRGVFQGEQWAGVCTIT